MLTLFFLNFKFILFRFSPVYSVARNVFLDDVSTVVSPNKVLKSLSVVNKSKVGFFHVACFGESVRLQQRQPPCKDPETWQTAMLRC